MLVLEVLLKSNATDELTIIDVGMRYAFEDNIRLSFGINNFMDDDRRMLQDVLTAQDHNAT